MDVKSTFELLVRECLKYFKYLMNYGGTRAQFQVFLLEKCNSPQEVYEEVITRFSKACEAPKSGGPKRNEPFKTNKNMPNHLFAKKMYKNILRTNVFFWGNYD